MDDHTTGDLHSARSAMRAVIVGATTVGVAVLLVAEAAGASAAAAMPAPPDSPCRASVAAAVTTSGTPSAQWLLVALLVGVVIAAGCGALSCRLTTAGWPGSRTRRIDEVDEPWLVTDLVTHG